MHMWGICPLLGLSEPWWHWAQVVHHPQSLMITGQTVGACPTFAWMTQLWVGVLEGPGVEMHRAPLHVLTATWVIAGGATDVACLDEDTGPCIYGSGGVPQESPWAHAPVEVCTCTRSIVHTGPCGSLCPFPWLRAVPSKYSPVG